MASYISQHLLPKIKGFKNSNVANYTVWYCVLHWLVCLYVQGRTWIIVKLVLLQNLFLFFQDI